jgi:hypothetical protein
MQGVKMLHTLKKGEAGTTWEAADSVTPGAQRCELLKTCICMKGQSTCSIPRNMKASEPEHSAGRQLNAAQVSRAQLYRAQPHATHDCAHVLCKIVVNEPFSLQAGESS